MLDLLSRSSGIIKDVRVSGYRWKEETVAVCQELPSPKERLKVQAINTQSGRRTRLPYAEIVAQRNSLWANMMISNNWLLWYTWDSTFMKVYAAHMNTRTSFHWRVRYASMFGGSLLTAPSLNSWTLLTENRGTLFATTGFLERRGDIRRVSLGLPAECLGGRSGNGAKLLDNTGGNRLLAMGISGYYLRPGKRDIPLFSFDKYVGKSSIRSESIQFELEGSLLEIEYSAKSNRLAILENLLGTARDSINSISPVTRVRLTTCHSDGSNVRVLGEIRPGNGITPRLLRWLPDGKHISFAYDNGIWAVKDEAIKPGS